MRAAEASGKIITFYSYKGGVGRTMALANVACLLASRAPKGRGVLMVDWDLEAPGLHRFFHKRLKEGERKLSDAEIKSRPGLIDLFRAYDGATRKAAEAGVEQTPKTAEVLVREFDPGRYILETDIPSLYLLKAGSFDDEYAHKVNGFRWEAFHERSPWLLGAFADHLARRFSYVLVDSRTGVTDTSGICTTLLPEKLVVVFTTNRQSLLGLKDPLQEVTKHRRRSDDMRPLTIFPLPSRIELSEMGLLEQWRHGEPDGEEPDGGVPGYRPMFESLFRNVYGLSQCDLRDYFDRVLIQHIPRYTYGEDIAVLVEKEANRLLLPESYKTFLDWLVNRPVPWTQEPPAAAPSFAEQIERAEAAFQHFELARQADVWRVLGRLVRVAPPGEGGEDGRQRVKLAEFNAAEQEIVRELADAGVLRVAPDAQQGGDVVELADDALVRQWQGLRERIKEERTFLSWRQALRADMARAADGGPLLVGEQLVRARGELGHHGDDLNAAEKEFIKESVRAQRRGRLRRQAAVGAVLLFALAVIGYLAWDRRRREADSRAAQSLYEQAVGAEETSLASALNLYDQAIALNPKLVDAYQRRGLARARAKDFAGAIADYDKAVELRPSLNDLLRPRYVEAHLGRGTVFHDEKKFAEAVGEYDAAVRFDPANAEVYYNRGLSYAAQGNYDQAIADYNKAIELRPDFAEAYYIRATSYREKAPNRVVEDYNRVIADYTEALNRNPELAEAYLNRGVFYLTLNDYKKAIADFDNYLKRRPGSPEAFNYRGLAYSGVKDYARAVADFNAAIDLKGDYVDAFFNRAAAYGESGRRDLAAEDLGRILTLTQDETVLRNARQALDRYQSPTSPFETTVAVHFVSSDADTFAAIRERLVGKGFLVQSIQQETSELAAADVRYFYKVDEQNAAFITRTVQEVFAARGVSTTVERRLLSRFARARNLRYGMIEVWLPSLSGDVISP